MVTKDLSQHLDVVIEVSNETYQEELTSLFKSCSLNPIVLKDVTAELIIADLARRNSRRAIYVTDNIDEVKLRRNKDNIAFPIDNILIVDEKSKDRVNDSPALVLFNHVLSCNTANVPNSQILGTVRKIRERDFFGVDKCVGYGAHVHRFTLGASDQRQWFRDSLFGFVKSLTNVINRPMDSYAQFAVEIQEELLMNAIWDANPRRRTSNRKESTTLLPHEVVQVEWCFDGDVLAVGVRDPFGTFEPAVIYKYLKFLFSADKKSMIRLQQEGNGAGLGLFMVLERLSTLVITVAPNQSTEVIALLHLGTSPRAFSKRQKSFQYFCV